MKRQTINDKGNQTTEKRHIQTANHDKDRQNMIERQNMIGIDIMIDADI